MKCNICGTSYSKGHKIDIGVGMMTVEEGEPRCDCYELTECSLCNEDMLQHELEDHECHTSYCHNCNSEYIVSKGCEVCEY